MSDLLSDLSFRQPQQLHGDEEENDGNDGDDNNELTRQLIYNNFRPDDDYGDICRVDRYQDDTTAVTAKIKVQGPDLDNVVDWTLFTNLSHDDYIFDYGHHSEDDEHDYNTQLYAMQRHNLSNRSKLLDNTILALLETTINRLLVIILSALSSFYILHLLPKLAHDFYIVEILWGLFKTLHWTWYLVAMWPVRLVLWCLATVFHVLTVLIWPSKVTLAIEFHAVIIYFLRQWRIKMMMKEARALE
ncbi:hypothetical protein BGZ95_009337 [Linnemannia exigua]|uniref:Uncharacterized protein n=1 Tax=Linnemannia exigua TaxID=604196 RepID=A0AAD4DD46_9FUNG|nr:hypothetical protein BGZ95_009337 [Linnemannia exigua]